jgi:agmatine deiminase
MKFNYPIFFITLHLALIISFLIPAKSIAQTSNKEQFTFPAEWEKHEAIWMSWRMPPSSRSIAKSHTVIEIIKTLTPHVKVNLFIDND